MLLRNGKETGRWAIGGGNYATALPNDLIMKIIQDASTQYGGRLWKLHQKKFNNAVLSKHMGLHKKGGMRVSGEFYTLRRRILRKYKPTVKVYGGADIDIVHYG